MEKISIVVPCYNEEEVLGMFYHEMIRVVEKLKNRYTYELIFVDDGSKDKTLWNLKELHQKNEKVKIISFSRNFGKRGRNLCGAC